MSTVMTENQETKEKSGIFIDVADHPCSSYVASENALQELIRQTRNKTIHPDFHDKISDEEILGMLISKYSKWDLNKIEEITGFACEDSNFKLKELVVE